MKKITLLTMLMVVAALVLVACDAVIPESTLVEESTPGADTEAAEVPMEEGAAEESGEAASEETAEQPSESAIEEPVTEGGRIVTAWIGPELVDCVGVAPQQCMQVKTNPDDDYGLFYDQIDGFEFEEGYEYELQVLVEPVQNPAQDASALKFTLIEVVSKTPAAGTEAQETAGESVEGAAEAAEAAAPLALEGPTWRLDTYVDLEGQPTQSLPDTRVTITFADGQVSGSAGCNNYFGTYEVDGSSLTVGQVGSTMMACFPDEVVLQETAFLANLGNVAGYEIMDNQLHLQDANGQTILIFSEDITPSLTGTVWTVTEFNNGNEAVVSVLDGTEMTAVFAEVGIVGGSAGCNNYRASFEADETNITIGPAAVTRKMCAEPEGIMEQEALYLAAMETAATYEIQGPRMDLYDADGARVAAFNATAAVEEVASESADLPVVAGEDGPDEAAAASAAAGAEAGSEAVAARIDLAGTRWQWMQMVTPVETFVPDDPGQYLMEFMADGVIGIQADCNSGSGTYETNPSEGSISINITNTTLALCPEGSLSDQFIRSLNAAAIYFDQDGNLFIDLFADGGTMEFAPN
ncbi:MAG: META domain-containing protein [Candidatus Promineifilaceae bacterium]